MNVPQRPLVPRIAARTRTEHPIPQLLQRLDELTQHRQALEQIAVELIENWRSTFHAGALPFYLTRLTGESLTLLRWRRAATTAGVGGRRFELMEADDPSLRTQSPTVCKTLFEFERRRIAINHDYALTAYELARLADFVRQRRRLAQARKLLGG